VSGSSEGRVTGLGEGVLASLGNLWASRPAHLRRPSDHNSGGIPLSEKDPLSGHPTAGASRSCVESLGSQRVAGVDVDRLRLDVVAAARVRAGGERGAGAVRAAAREQADRRKVGVSTARDRMTEDAYPNCGVFDAGTGDRVGDTSVAVEVAD